MTAVAGFRESGDEQLVRCFLYCTFFDLVLDFLSGFGLMVGRQGPRLIRFIRKLRTDSFPEYSTSGQT